MVTQSRSFSDLINPIKNKLTSSELDRIKNAYEFSQEVHQGQTRYSGEPYFNHLYNTSSNLILWGLDSESIIAGLLHDAVEDSNIPSTEIEQRFGKSVSGIVDGVTKVGKIRLRNSQQENFLENLRKMMIASTQDIRVIVVKLADRLDNIRTLQYVPETKQKRIAKETLEVYAPIAERLGMGIVKRELEDISFSYADPEKFRWVKNISSQYFQVLLVCYKDMC